jgi:hypothetical protein
MVIGDAVKASGVPRFVIVYVIITEYTYRCRGEGHSETAKAIVKYTEALNIPVTIFIHEYYTRTSSV